MRRYLCSLHCALTVNSVQTVQYEKLSFFQFRNKETNSSLKQLE